MMFRGVIIIVALVASAALCSGYILTSNTSAKTPSLSRSDSLDLAPLSLGNPTAVPGIRTRSPEVIKMPNLSKLPKWTEHAIYFKRGDTLAKLLIRTGIDKQAAHKAIRAFAKVHNPRRIRQGDKLRITYAPHMINDSEKWPTPGTFMGLFYIVSPNREVQVLRKESGEFIAVSQSRDLNHQIVRAEGIIKSSLYLAGKAQHLSDSTLAELIRLFSWDVDFQRDIRKNDQFQIMYNRITDEDGKIVTGGEILFAALTLSGKRKTIYRFTGEDNHIEYFDKNGHSAQKALMRTPIDGARLSSRFGRRVHPVLGYTKMHRGLDFAAPRGTPIYAAGNGTIEYIGRKGAYGKYIRIRHNKNYKTAYAHMKGYARGMRTHRRVTQGQVIGYVGSTGRSTGPHLHYEILRAGRQVNPLRVRMPSGRKLKASELARFQTLRKTLDHRYRLIPTAPVSTAQR